MGILDRFKPALPALPIGPETADQVNLRVAEMCHADDEALVEACCEGVRAVVREDLFSLARPFIDAAGLDREELATELYLQAWIGFLLAVEAKADRARALEMLAPYQASLRDYVGLGWRERYDPGPEPVLQAAEKVSVNGRDPRHVVMGFLAMRIGVIWRKGGTEGLFALAMLAQTAGYGVGELAWQREALKEAGGEEH
ncbi:MAG: hypothetical protein H6741_19995 [Alphaproteobacteria bacterium]|nr:hypothetical protein [Alphaproteobacteria bacterium]